MDTIRSTIPQVNDLEEYLTSTGFAKKDVKNCALFLQMIEEHKLRRSASTFRAGEIVLEHTNEKATQTIVSDENSLRFQSFDGEQTLDFVGANVYCFVGYFEYELETSWSYSTS